MGNTQANEKHSKTGKSPAKGKHFIRNLNRKSPGRESKKHGRKKSAGNREAIREFDKTPDSDNVEVIETSDNDMVECSIKTVQEGEGEWSVQSEVTVSRCERSVTRSQPAAAAPPVSSPTDHSTSDSVFTDPLVAAVELNHCYYSAESDSASAPEHLAAAAGTALTPDPPDADADAPAHATIDMPHDDAASSLSADDAEKEERNDVFDDIVDKEDNSEKIMGALNSRSRIRDKDEQLKQTNECNHDFHENRLKSSSAHISFTLSKHRKVELPPVTCESSLTLLDDESDSDRRYSSVSDVPMAESNVLRKVASLTLDKHSESKVARTKFLPDKIDFRLYQKFEGQMLLNSFISSITANSHLRNLLTQQELRNLTIQFCTHLLEAGVVIQIPDKNAPTENTFKPSLMYYWARMDTPECQPVTPGRLHTTSWPPDKDQQLCTTQDKKSNLDNNKFFSPNNNEEIGDINDAKIYIALLQNKIQELENQIKNLTLNTQIETLNKSIEKGYDLLTDPNRLTNITRNKTQISSKETNSFNVSEVSKLDTKPVITIPEYPIKTNVNAVKNLDLSSLDNKIDMTNKDKLLSSTSEVRSDKIENYCKLNKSREYNKSFKNNSKSLLDNKDDETSATTEDTLRDTGTDLEFNSKLSNSSESSFRSIILCRSIDMITNNENSLNVTSDNQILDKSYNSPEKSTTDIMYSNIEYRDPVSYDGHNISSLEHDSLIFIESEIKKQDSDDAVASMTSGPVAEKSLEIESPYIVNNHTITSPPPPHPGVPPPPPPMPGTDTTQCEQFDLNFKHLPTTSSPKKETIDTTINQTQRTTYQSENEQHTSLEASTPPFMSAIFENSHATSPLSNEGPVGPPPPSMPGMGPPPPPMPGMGPPPPPMPGMGPPPPPMPGMGPPPPPMPGMGPPPPPMPGMGPPPPPMPGMGPPPPPLPGMSLPPPPPMPGSGPPPPPPAPGAIPPPPPPNNTGPIPFPAPPVGGWNMQRATLRKTPIKPAAPMKPLYWTRILAMPPPAAPEPETVQVKPLWLEIEEANLDNIDEFTDLFSRQVIKAPVRKKVEVKTKIQPVKILDSKRSQNVGILAQSLHVEFSEIENAIYNFDTSVVSLEALQQIYELRANDEELAQIREHLSTKPDIPLDKPEAFLHDLSGIPNFADRISCFMFQADFEDSVSTTMHKLDNLKHTCEFLMTSESLKNLFAIILTLGNYMNGGNGQRGQADGFGLEILSKLKDVKSKQSNVTLLHFIVRTYMRARGGALAAACALPVPEPGDVARASTLDFADVASHLATLTKQLTACQEKTKKVIDADALSRSQGDDCSSGEGKKRLDVFKDKMTTFLNAAEEKLKTENENLEECKTKFIATVKFYQYSPKCGKLEDCEPKEFFSLWTSFCTDFKDIFKKEEQLAIKEKLKEAKKLKDERKSLTQPKKEGGLKARLQKLSSSKK